MEKEKQNWHTIELAISIRKETLLDMLIARIMFNAGWEVYPEAGHRFQKNRGYEDCEHNDGMSNEEAKAIIKEFVRDLYSTPPIKLISEELMKTETPLKRNRNLQR